MAAASSQHRHSPPDHDKIPIYVRVVPYDQWFRLNVPRKATVADLKDIVLARAGIEHSDPSFLLAHGGGIAPGPRKSDFKSIIDAAASAQLDLEAKSPSHTSSALQRYHSSLGSADAIQSQGHLTPAILPTSVPKTYMARAPNPLSALGRNTRAGSLPLVGLGVNVVAQQHSQQQFSTTMPGSADLVKSVTVAGTPTPAVAHKLGTSSGSDSGSSFGPRAPTDTTDSRPTSKRPSLTPSMSSPQVGVGDVRSTSALSSSSSASRPTPLSDAAAGEQHTGSSRAPASTFLARLTHHKQVRSRASMSSLHQVLNAHLVDREGNREVPQRQPPPPFTEGRASPTAGASPQLARSSSPRPAAATAGQTSSAAQEIDDGLDAYWLDYEDILSRAQAISDRDHCSSPSSNGSEFARLLSGNEDAKKKEQEALKALQRSQERMRQAASSASAGKHISPSTSDGSLGNQASLGAVSDIAAIATTSHSQATGTTTSMSPLASPSSPWSSAASLDADAVPPKVSPSSPLTSTDAPAPSASLAIPGARSNAKLNIRPTSSVQDEDAASSSSQLDALFTDDVVAAAAAAITPLSGSSPPSSPMRLRTTSESNLWGTQLEEVLAKRGIVTEEQDQVKRKASASMPAERTRSGTITGNRRPLTSSSVASQDSLDGPSSSSAPANDLLGIDRSMSLARSTIDEHEAEFKPMPVSSSLPNKSAGSRASPAAAEHTMHKRSVSSMVRIAGINTNEMAQFRPSHHPLSAHYVMISFSGGYVLEEFSTIAGLKLRPYELLEVQLADAEDRVRLPRLQELHINGTSGIERRMWDPSYLEPYAHGWMYIFRPRMASANATRVGLGTWKLRWFMLQGRTLSMYRRRPSKAACAAAAATQSSYLRPNASKREAEKRKEHHSQLLVLTWSMNQLRWVGSERSDTVGSGVHAPSAPASVSTAPPFLSQDVLTVGFSRPPDAAGYGQSLPGGPGGGSAVYDAGHTISLRCLTEHQTATWYKCFQRAQYRSTVESLDGQVETKDLDMQRVSGGGRGRTSRRPSTLETPPRIPISVDLWRQRALSRSLLAGRGGIVTPGKVGRMGGRNALVRSRVRPRNTGKEWDDADQWSDDSQDEDFLAVAAE